MNVHKATRNYERWMAKHIAIVKPDLQRKHREMIDSLFAFLRATFYRWIQLGKETCEELASAPSVLAVGDLHVENFGTWRDSEGRLIWGVNDFDEAYPAAYTMDLVRLATSALLATKETHLSIQPREACDAVLEGYAEGLEKGGKPFVLGEHHVWLRKLALNELRDPVHFWDTIERLPDAKGKIPAEARRAIESALPERSLKYRLKRRVAGLGSLGHQRLVALAQWRGAYVAREAKALMPSAFTWEQGKGRGKIWYTKIIAHAVRVLDPCVHLRRNWLLRRLAPDCSRVELASLPKQRDESALLHAMGRETANIHLGSRNSVSAVRKDLKKRRASWLHHAAAAMADAVASDWKDWKHSAG